MLVVDDAADHHIADVGIERRSLAEDVHTAKIDGFRDLAQDVVRGQSERVIDVDDHRPARGKGDRVDGQHAVVAMLRVHPVERDDLRGDVQRGPAGHAQGARLALLAAERGAFGVGQKAEAFARRVIQKVVPVALRGAVAEAEELVAKLAPTLAIDSRRELVDVAWRDPGEQVGDRVRVAADEVHGPVEERFGAHQPGHLLPPPASHPGVADLRAAEHAHPQRHALLRDLCEPGTECRAPDLVQL